MFGSAALIGSPGTAWSDGGARLLSFSFAKDGLSAIDPALADGAWASVSAAQRVSARAALAEFAGAAGLVFVEVPDSAAGALSDLRFRLEEFDPRWVAGRARPAPFGEIALSLPFSQNDILAGGSGADTLRGSTGDDLLIGQGGLSFWMDIADPVSIARGILASDEHRALVAEADPVARFYLGALSRAPEDRGHALWTALLPADAGAVLLGIAGSMEATSRADLAGDWLFA